MDKIAYLADSLRQLNPIVYLISAGDNFTGNPIVDMVPDKGAPMIDIMNQCGFNLSCIGNHEFDMGQELFNKKMEEAHFPFISANIDSKNAILNQPRPYFIVNAGEGDSIAFLGLIQLGIHGTPDAHPSRLKGVVFSDGIEVAKKYQWLKDRYGMVIGLTHLGFDKDVELANSTSFFDVIIGGHSHTRLDSAVYAHGVPIVQTGSYVKNIGKLTLTISDHRITQCTYELIPLDKITKRDVKVRETILKYNNNEAFKEVVATTDSPIEGFDNLGAMVTDAVRFETHADFSFQNRKGMRIGMLEQGPITLKDIYQLDPFQNELVEYLMTPDELKSLICNAYTMEKRIDLAVSGLTYTVLTSNGKCIGVELLLENGQPLVDTTYKVVFNDYIATSYTFDHAEKATYTGISSTEALVRFLKAKKEVHYTGIKRTFQK